MKVHLRRNYFSPDQELFDAKRSPVEMSDSHLGHLPADARIDGKSLAETQALVAAERKKLGLGTPNPAAGEIDMDPEIDGKSDDEDDN